MDSSELIDILKNQEEEKLDYPPDLFMYYTYNKSNAQTVKNRDKYVKFCADNYKWATKQDAARYDIKHQDHFLFLGLDLDHFDEFYSKIVQKYENWLVFEKEFNMLAVRVINANKTSGPNHDFINSVEVGSIITAPDWNPSPQCGNGIHGWLWGIGRDGKFPQGDKIWQVVEVPDDGVQIEGKWKWKSVKVVYSGTEPEAMRLTMEGRRNHTKRFGIFTIDAKTSAADNGNYKSVNTQGVLSSATASGDGCSAETLYVFSSASVSGGKASATTSGPCSVASVSGSDSSANTFNNHSPAVTSGLYCSANTLGKNSPAITANNSSSASTAGQSSPAICAGTGCKAKAGLYGYIVLGYIALDHIEYKGARVGYGPGELKPDTWYKLENEKFVECEG